MKFRKGDIIANRHFPMFYRVVLVAPEKGSSLYTLQTIDNSNDQPLRYTTGYVEYYYILISDIFREDEDEI